MHESTHLFWKQRCKHLAGSGVFLRANQRAVGEQRVHLLEQLLWLGTWMMYIMTFSSMCVYMFTYGESIKYFSIQFQRYINNITLKFVLDTFYWPPTDFSLVHGTNQKLHSIILFLLIFPFFASHSNGSSSSKLGPVTNYTETVPKASGCLCRVTTVQEWQAGKWWPIFPCSSLRPLWLVICCFAAVVFLLSFCLKRFNQHFVFIEL